MQYSFIMGVGVAAGFSKNKQFTEPFSILQRCYINCLALRARDSVHVAYCLVKEMITRKQAYLSFVCRFSNGPTGLPTPPSSSPCPPTATPLRPAGTPFHQSPCCQGPCQGPCKGQRQCSQSTISGTSALLATHVMPAMSRRYPDTGGNH